MDKFLEYLEKAENIFYRQNTKRDTSSKRRENKMMSDKMIENNQVSIVGEVVSDFSFSHEVFGEGFYMLDV